FLLNALLFALIGLQLPAIIDALSGTSPGTLVRHAVVVTAAVIGARILWIFAATYLPRMLPRHAREGALSPPWQEATVLTWSGMRGAVSLAAALALPLATDAGTPFPNRDLIVFLTFAVILGTLVLQGLTLPSLIDAVGLEDDRLAEKEEAKARIHAAEAALARLEELLEEEWVLEDTADRLRGLYNFRRERFRSRFGAESDRTIEDRSSNYQRLRHELLAAERRAILELRRSGRIDDAVMRRVERDLDLEDARLDL
ncbi:MAG: cation:proton antiporter, partial [Acidimicrobiia bacterium]